VYLATNAALHLSTIADLRESTNPSHYQLDTRMAMTGGCEPWSPHDHGSRPDQRSGIRMDQHSDLQPWAAYLKIPASIFKTAWKMERYFSLMATTLICSVFCRFA
jgi:hypothetical protein